MRWSICYVRGVTEDRHGSDALEKLRREMDALDEQIVELLRRRAGVSAQVGQVKPGDGRSVYAPAREAELLDRLTRLRHRRAPARGPSRDLPRDPVGIA